MNERLRVVVEDCGERLHKSRREVASGLDMRPTDGTGRWRVTPVVEGKCRKVRVTDVRSMGRVQ